MWRVVSYVVGSNQYLRPRLYVALLPVISYVQNSKINIIQTNNNTHTHRSTWVGLRRNQWPGTYKAHRSLGNVQQCPQCLRLARVGI